MNEDTSQLGGSGGERARRPIKIAHSPDADDAFMFYALFGGKVEGLSLPIEEVREDIETLNQKAREGAYEVTAVSIHAYPYIADKYLLLTTGGCFGEGYGPIIVASKPLKPRQLLKVRIGIPGKLTSAFLALKLYEQHLAGEGRSGMCYSQAPFDQLIDKVVEGKLDAALLIHEGQLNYMDKGLHKIADLGEWWKKETGLPLPLGGIAIRRDLAPELMKKIGDAICASVQYGLDPAHKDEVMAHALPFARGLDAEKAAQFVGLYVNDFTVDFGRKGLKAIRSFLDLGWRRGLVSLKTNWDDTFFDVRRGKIRHAVVDEEIKVEESTSEEVIASV